MDVELELGFWDSTPPSLAIALCIFDTKVAIGDKAAESWAIKIQWTTLYHQ